MGCVHMYTHMCALSVYLGTEYSRQKVWLLRRFWFRKYWLSCSLEEAKELSNCPQTQKGIIRISLWSQLHFGQLAKRDLVRLLPKSENVRLWFAGTNSQYPFCFLQLSPGRHICWSVSEERAISIQHQRGVCVTAVHAPANVAPLLWEPNCILGLGRQCFQNLATLKKKKKILQLC